MASSLNNLADDLRGLGEYGRARELDEQALAMCQRLYEGDHPDVASSLSNLAERPAWAGGAMRGRGSWTSRPWPCASGCMRVTTPMWPAAWATSPSTCARLGEYGRARELDEQALAMYQRLFEGDHPYVASSLSNLADDLRALGEDERARELDEQALAMHQRLAQR